MKSIFTSVVAIFLLTGCNKIDPASPAGCSDPQYKSANRYRELKKMDTYVFALPFTRPDSSMATSYFIRNPDSNADLSMTWIPCNLPEEYQKDKLPVQISGYVMTFPGDELRNSIGQSN